MAREADEAIGRIGVRLPAYEVLGIDLALGAWTLLSHWIDPTLLPSPRRVLHAFLGTLGAGEFVPALAQTLRNVAIAFAIGSVIGVALGLLVGVLKVMDLFLSPYLYSVYSLPKVALIPLFVVWLGIGPHTIVVVTSIATALLVAINVIDGVKSVDPTFIRAARNLGASRTQIFVKIIMPAASGMIMSGLRLGIGQALITGVAAEIVLAGSGIGALMWDSQQALRTDLVFVCLFTLAAIGALSAWLLGAADRLLFPWRMRDGR